MPGVAEGMGVAPGAGLGLGLAAVTDALDEPLVPLPAAPTGPVA